MVVYCQYQPLAGSSSIVASRHCSRNLLLAAGACSTGSCYQKFSHSWLCLPSGTIAATDSSSFAGTSYGLYSDRTGCAPIKTPSSFLGHLQHSHFIASLQHTAVMEDLDHHSLVLADTFIVDCPYLESQTAGHSLSPVP